MAKENKELEDLKKRAEKAESDLEKLKKEMAKETEAGEIESLKQQLKEAKDKIEAFEKAQDSDAEKAKADELQKLKDDLAAAKLQIHEAETEKAFAEKAAELKAKNPAKLLALVKDKIEFDETGKPKNLKEVLEQAKKDYSEEFETKTETKTKSVDGGKRDEPGKTNDDLTPMERMRLGYEEQSGE